MVIARIPMGYLWVAPRVFTTVRSSEASQVWSGEFGVRNSTAGAGCIDCEIGEFSSVFALAQTAIDHIARPFHHHLGKEEL
jgi:hypothetical protein